MKVVLTEKPSVARDIAAVLGARTKREGYYEGGEYQVTWAFGHLVALKEPGDYDPALKRWSLESLPIVPERFELKLIGDGRARQQFKAIQQLLKKADAVVCATDAGREGELIFRYILTLAQAERKPAQRLWLSSLTPEAIRTAFRELRPLQEYDNLYAAAKCRSESDWIVGLNATRHLTVRYGADGILWSVGRVQTPVLAMIAERDDTIRTFRSEPFWELMTNYRDVVFRHRGDRFGKEEDAQAQLKQVEGHPFTIKKVDTKRQKESPPLLHDLTDLQREMNRRYGISAANTLKSAQSLYEAQCITYPRTDSRYLSKAVKSDIPEVLMKLQRVKKEEIALLSLDKLPFSSRIVNDSKVTDHHAIIPTGKIPANLSQQDQQVFDAIVTRLIAAFYPPCLKDVTTVDGTTNRVAFRARGVRIVDPGWTILYPRQSGRSDDQEDEQALPEFKAGESGPHKPFVKEGKTQPPKHFTENSLLAAMETAGRLVEEEHLKDALKEKGLGTPATRAAIIETLLKRGYLTRQNKQLLATDLGRYLVALVKHPHLKSAELTGEWEAKLKAVEQGKLGAEQFMQEIVAFTQDVLEQHGRSSMDGSKLGNCPLCERPVIEGKRGYGCSGWREGCTFVMWSEYEGMPLTEHKVRELLQHRMTLQPVELPEKGKSVLYLSSGGHVLDVAVPSREQQKHPNGKKSKSARNETAPSSPKKASNSPKRESPPKKAGSSDTATELGDCPVCGRQIIVGQRGYGCSGWREGCKFVIWKEIAGKKIRASTAKRLLQDGKTSKLKGFQSKAGKPFDARLKLEEGQVRLDF